MSVDCAVMFNDPERTVITMTVWDWSPDGYDLARVLNLAVAAYESRMKRAPPLIAGSSKYLDGIVDILGIQERNILTGKTGSVLQQGEYRRTMMFARALFGWKREDNGDAPRPHDESKRRRPHVRSMAEWREFQRRKDLRRIARADADLRRELLKTFDTCPCCERWLKREEDQRREGVERETMQFARGPRLLPVG
jgi:hypothetical protein